MAICALGLSLTAPSLTGLVSQTAALVEQGVVLGTMTAVASLARVGGPLWAGLAYDHWGQGAPYWTAALWLLLALAMVVRARPTAA
jgi:predicted MFS family arabinose efflux permease